MCPQASNSWLIRIMHGSWECSESVIHPARLFAVLRLSNCAGQDEQDAADADADSDDVGRGMSEAKRACLIYRSSQKRIAREYLIRARQELNNGLNQMRKLQEKE